MLIVSQELYLYPWDAGVDSGISYESPDQQTFPNQPIKVKQFYNYVHIFNHCFLLLEFVFKYLPEAEVRLPCLFCRTIQATC